MLDQLREMRKNWYVLVASFIISSLIWVFVMREQNPVIEMSYTVPIQTQNLEQGLLVDGVPKEVRIKVHGPRNSILDIDPHTLKAYINLADVTMGQNTVKIEFNAPTGTVVDSMSINQATIDVDEYVVKEFNVEAQPNGKIPDDIAIKSINIVPKVVSISGPKHLVNRVVRAVVPVNVDNRRDSFTAVADTTPIDSAGKLVEGVTVTPKPAQVQYDLERIRIDKKVPIDATITGTPAAGFVVKSVAIDPKEISISGKEGIIKNIDKIKTDDISVNGASTSFQGTYNLILGDDVNSKITQVGVRIEIGPRQ